MHDDSPPVELGALGKIAAFFCFTAGVAAVFAGGQVWSVLIFRHPWQQALPLTQVGLGFVALWVATQIAYPRRWALFVGAVVLGGLACGGLPWAGWLMVNGVFTALSIFSPGWAVLAALFLAAASPSILRVGKARAWADAETDRLTREAMAAGYGYARPPRAGAGWVLPVVYAVLLLPVALLVLAIGWPERFTALKVRSLALLHGRTPLSGFVEARQGYPYTISPFESYLDYEAKFRTLERADVLAFVDDIADDTATRLVAETGERDLARAEVVLWESGRQEALPLWIAESLRAHRVFYHLESLLSRSFDPELHVQPDAVHLDCDQLVYVFEHVAWRLDLDMRPVPAPMHLYLRYAGPTGAAPLFVETTRFSDAPADGAEPDELAASRFFVDEGYYRRGEGGSYASAEIIEAAGYYEPYAERDILDEIVANVIEGLDQAGVTVPASEAEAHLGGTRSVTLVTNLYLRYLRAAQQAFEQGDFSAAKAGAVRAHTLRAEHGALVVYTEPKEDQLLADIAAITGEAPPVALDPSVALPPPPGE